jgi:ATP-dependent DNA ligase
MTLPRIKPIAPTWRKEPVDDSDWLFDLKYDGSRGLTYIASTRASAIARFLATAKQERRPLISERS